MQSCVGYLCLWYVGICLTPHVLTVYPGEHLPSTAKTAKKHFGKNEEHEQLCGELLTAVSL